MEACGGSQHWARKLAALGHQVKLMPAKAVRPLSAATKSDVQTPAPSGRRYNSPGIKAVAIKTEEQQSHPPVRMRSQLVKFRPRRSTVCAAVGGVRVRLKAWHRPCKRLADRLPAMVIDTLRESVGTDWNVDEQIGEIERRLKVWLKERSRPGRIVTFPGGAADGDGGGGDDGRCQRRFQGGEFAARLARSRQSGTVCWASSVDTYLRTLLMHGARSMLLWAKEPGTWIEKLRQRRPWNVVVALGQQDGAYDLGFGWLMSGRTTKRFDQASCKAGTTRDSTS